MGQADRGVEIATGRRRTDGHVRLALFTRDLLALTLEEYGERAPTLLLTRAQAVELQQALAQLLALLPADAAVEAVAAARQWAGPERRSIDELQ